MKEILDVIHKTIYQFFDVCDDSEETPMTDKDKLLLEVNKAICNNIKALKQEPKTIPLSVYEQICGERDIAISQLQELGYEFGEKIALEQEPILDKIRAEIADLDDADYDYEGYYKAVTDALQVIDKYR